jgi:DNA repair photolyase
MWRGRGAESNLPNRFDTLHVEPDYASDEEIEHRPLKTVFLRDDSQSVLVANTSEDLSFDYGLNPYRGCEHGCAYCYARTYHEYLGFSAGLDFESKIVVKENAPELLESALAKPSYKVGKIAMSGVTDCYQPVERKLEITRRCLDVLARFRNPVTIITKNALVARDIDHLTELSRHNAVAVYLSITTLDPKLARVLEPRASSPRARLETIRQLTEAGIHAGVSAAPMIPGLNDSELPTILKAVADHGGRFAAYSAVRLPGAVKDVFSSWLDQHQPLAKEKVLGRIRALHSGSLNSTIPGTRNRGTGEQSKQLNAMFRTFCRRYGMDSQYPRLSAESFRRVMPGQAELF